MLAAICSLSGWGSVWKKSCWFAISSSTAWSVASAGSGSSDLAALGFGLHGGQHRLPLDGQRLLALAQEQPPPPRTGDGGLLVMESW